MKIRRPNKPNNAAPTNDIFNDMLLPLKERTNRENCAYFYRLIGFDNQTEFQNKVTLLHQQLAQLGDLYLYLVDSIPLPFNKSLADRISQALTNLNDNEPTAICELLDQANLFPTPKMKGSLTTVLELFIKNEPTANISIVKNFISKMMLWAHQHVPTLYRQTNSEHNPKVLYFGDIKKHSVYFLILLSRLDCDVLYINPHSDVNYQKVDRSNQFSQLIVGSIKTKLPEPLIKEIFKETPKVAPIATPAPPITGRSVAVKLKTCIDIWQDILLPLSKRSGYLGNPAPILPIYFYRLIGLKGTSTAVADEFYNTLYQLDKTFANRVCGYIRLTNYLAMPNNSDIARYKTKLQQTSNGDTLVNKVIQANILPTTGSEPMNNTIKTAFQQTMGLFINQEYISQEPNSNPAKLENFALKLIGWVNMYFSALYTNFDFLDNPKVLYYGDIKQHEVYFLILLAKIGCDVLYVNTDRQQDDIFKEIDPDQEYSKLIEQQHSAPLEPFPEVERVVRKATVAYNASQQIQQVIYSEDAGLFKPWQFQDYQTKPVTLRTTYDELGILWNEEARIRPEFKVVNGTVYVPNLFAKIKGTHEDLSLYWQDYKLLTGAKNTHVVTQVPFTWVNYSKRDLYASAFLFNSDGTLNKDKLLQCSFYRFGYLRNSLQDLIINKINELIKVNPFIDADKELPLKIMMTIMTMDDSILRLIEAFDYPREVPKLVIYDSTREVFSDEDAIIIAFLNMVGVDIAIFTPTNYNNIELKLKADLLDEHQLPSLQLGLSIPDLTNVSTETGKIGSFFSQLTTKIRRKFRED
jgi:hypothetical protein